MSHIDVIALAMVKNEADVIEPFVRHNLQFLDAMFVLENGSTDGTRTILLELQREGLPLAILDDPVPQYTQSEKMTSLVRCLSSTVFPEFLVPLDADEFIRCDSRETFIRALETIEPGGVGTMDWMTYVLTPSDLDARVADPPRDMRYRRAVENPPYSKAILRAGGAYLPHYGFAQGNHSVSRTDGRPLAAVRLDSVSLGHFPVRSEEQFEVKAVVGWTAHLRAVPNARDAETAYQWRVAFDMVAQGGYSQTQLAEASALYAQNPRSIDWDTDVVEDPIPFSYTRRYSPDTPTSTVSQIARSWETSLAEPWSFSASIDDRIERIRQRAGSDSIVDRPPTAFDDDWHLERPYVDVPPMRFLAEKHRPTSVLDVGCGLGAYLMIFEQIAKSEVFGIEGFDADSVLLDPEKFGNVDISQGFDLGRRFDLVMCVEVLEHLPAEHESIVLDAIASHADDLILFSAADENQPGHGHINCRPVAHWLAEWADRGWEPILFDTLAFRALATFSWLRRNPILLRRSQVDTPVGDEFDTLGQIGAKGYLWYGQDPEIVDYALTQDPPHDVYEPGFV